MSALALATSEANTRQTAATTLSCKSGFRRCRRASPRWENIGRRTRRKKTKRQAFTGFEVGVAVDGLGTFDFSDAELSKIDGKQAKSRRVLEKGGACKQLRDNKFEKISNQELFKRWKILPTKLEIAVRRAKWLANIIRFPADHRQLRIAVWGQPVGEKPTLSGEGKLEEHAIFLARAFERDLRLYEGISGTEGFFDQWAIAGGSWKELLCWHSWPAKAFLKLDASLLCVFAWTACTEKLVAARRALDSEAASQQFVCDIVVGENVCGRSFDSKQALVQHQFRSKARGY